jgi:hypothetical protein
MCNSHVNDVQDCVMLVMSRTALVIVISVVFGTVDIAVMSMIFSQRRHRKKSCCDVTGSSSQFVFNLFRKMNEATPSAYNWLSKLTTNMSSDCVVVGNHFIIIYGDVHMALLLECQH